MSIYGLDNVRGGSFCELILDNTNKEIINKMLNGSSNKCYKCGETGYFVNDCNKKIEKREYIIYENQRKIPLIGWTSKLLSTDRFSFSSEDGNYELNKEVFFLDANETIVSGWKLSGDGDSEGWMYSSDFSNKYKSEYDPSCFVRRRKWIMITEFIQNENIIQEQKVSASKFVKPNPKVSASKFVKPNPKVSAGKFAKQNNNNTCYRCGRNGHYINDCYATTHKNGKLLDSDESNSDESYSDDIVWICEYCDREFNSENDAYEHEKICKKAYTNSEFKCRYCSKTFSSKKGAIYHENIYCKKK